MTHPMKPAPTCDSTERAAVEIPAHLKTTGCPDDGVCDDHGKFDCPKCIERPTISKEIAMTLPLIEPSDAEQATWLEATETYVATLQATVERQAAQIARKDAALREIVVANQKKHWTRMSGLVENCWVYHDGQYAKIAHKALEDTNG